MLKSFGYIASAVAFLCAEASATSAAENVMLLEVPDYAWHAGCFGTASAILLGYWDRHGLTNIYSGPTADGLAPMNSVGANSDIRGFWASQGGVDGRPIDKPGHIEDYWEYFDGATSFESSAPDPYLLAGRPEHEPDCLGDFIGQSQRKYSDLNGECTGNIDGYAFTYWDKAGKTLINFQPPMVDGVQVRDIPSGLRAWTRHRGYEAEVFSQLADFNVSSGEGFTFDDLKAEIKAGYPCLLVLQNPGQMSRSVPGLARANPSGHAMVAYGYLVTDSGNQFVRYRTSWASGDNSFALWESGVWEAALPLRGIIGYRPLPKITNVERAGGRVTISSDGPNSVLKDNIAESATPVHWYIVERSETAVGSGFTRVSEPTPELTISFPDSNASSAFFRVRLLTRPEAEQI